MPKPPRKGVLVPLPGDIGYTSVSGKKGTCNIWECVGHKRPMILAPFSGPRSTIFDIISKSGHFSIYWQWGRFWDPKKCKKSTKIDDFGVKKVIKIGGGPGTPFLAIFRPFFGSFLGGLEMPLGTPLMVVFLVLEFRGGLDGPFFGGTFFYIFPL